MGMFRGFLILLFAFNAQADQPKIIIPAEGDRPEIVLISVWDHRQLFWLMTSTENLDDFFMRDSEKLLTLSPESARIWLPEANPSCPVRKRFPHVEVDGEKVPLWTTPRSMCVDQRDRQVARLVRKAPLRRSEYQSMLYGEYSRYRELKEIIQAKCESCAGKKFVLDAMGLKAEALMVDVPSATYSERDTAQSRTDRYNMYKIVEDYGTDYEQFRKRHGKYPIVTDDL